jgi:peptidoglycan hydrolase CwlO-like protein
MAVTLEGLQVQIDILQSKLATKVDVTKINELQKQLDQAKAENDISKSRISQLEGRIVVCEFKIAELQSKEK